jgi:ribose 5-phosphate isomerase B
MLPGRKRRRTRPFIQNRMATIYVSSDHAGFELRRKLTETLAGAPWADRGFVVEDLGPADPAPVDYPDEAHKVARRVAAEPGARGLLVCGSGVGMCIAANRTAGVRAVDAWNLEVARLSRAHNDANVLCLGARLITEGDARAILAVWLATPFDGGRHAGRIAKLDRVDG